MSYVEAQQPECTAQDDDIRCIITPNSKDLGDFSVRRVLPSSMVPRVGPFVFFDHMGPATFPSGKGINVRPHPHIGLSTVTYLFEGEILHRDSLGYVQAIQPGAVNLMTAGKGIVHSERTSDALLESGQTLHGLQVWMALPDDQQEIDPAFEHYPAHQLPVVETDAVRTTVVIGTFEGVTSAVSVLPETLYLDQQVLTDTSFMLADCAEERGVYPIEGSISIGNCTVEPGSMAILAPGKTVTVTATAGSRLVTIGGEAMSDRHLWWNFVHTDQAHIEAAKRRWTDGGFGAVPGDDEFIPLPE